MSARMSATWLLVASALVPSGSNTTEAVPPPMRVPDGSSMATMYTEDLFSR